MNSNQKGTSPRTELPEKMGVRYLSNYVYCPRLFYLQWVEQIFVPNADTAAGTATHRQVDKPSRIEDWDGLKLSECSKLRSVQLDSESLGLVGEIDLIEGGTEGGVILDYKKGSARRLDDGTLTYKENDAIQVAAYALMARETGHAIVGAAIYYAGNRRRIGVELTEAMLAQVGSLLIEARTIANSGKCPPPLSHDPRCAHCSAYPICLPNESRYWAQPNEAAPKELEPPLADRDEGEVLVVQDFRAYVGKHGDEVRVTREGVVLAKLPLYQLKAIYLYGPVQISAQLVHICLEENLDIAYFSASGRFIGLLRGLPASGVDARRGQYRLFSDPITRLQLAREIVSGKIHNQRVMLMRNGDVSNVILERMKNLRDQTGEATNEAALLGIEGEAASLYFGHFPTMIKNTAFDFTHRNRRPPRDPVNSLLSLGYSVLAKELSGVCHTVGLDPFFGFYHHARYGRPALALDLMEEFRPLTVDSLTIFLLNRNELDPIGDFIHSTHGCQLSENGRRIFWQGWFRRMDTEVGHPVFGYKMSYRRMLEIQTRQLWRFLRGEAKTYTAFTTR